jgi:hypothetical protein
MFIAVDKPSNNPQSSAAYAVVNPKDLEKPQIQ